jgi:hypothetical protein
MALNHSDKVKRAVKLRELEKLARSFQIICLAEVHGSRAAIQSLIGSLANSHVLLYSPSITDQRERRDKGGIACLVHKSFLGDNPCFRTDDLLEVIVSGRVIRVAIPIFGTNRSPQRAFMLSLRCTTMIFLLMKCPNVKIAYKKT